MACPDCAATVADGALFPPKKRGSPAPRCLDCELLAARPPREPGLARPVTRARARARFRRRAESAQLDLVDLIQGRPP